MDAKALSALVADIYDAALDPPAWRKVLKDICGFVGGGPSASLFWQDAVKRTGKTCYIWGGDPLYNRLYWDKYVGLNPFTAAAGDFPVEGIYSAADILPPAGRCSRSRATRATGWSTTTCGGACASSFRMCAAPL
jgi:hypothetical protein